MISEIINANISKTEKIKMLLELGKTRKEVAELLNVGYGFVQNVYAKLYPNRISTRERTNLIFKEKFGVEIEAYGIPINTLRVALTEAGINCESERYNHTTRGYWKIVSDGSLVGQNAFEVVSPILKGEEGLLELEKVCEVLKAKRARINKTCGLHIHFNARDWELNQWKNLLINYSLVEEHMDKLMPESRKANNNNYCKGFQNINNLRSRIENCTDLQGIDQIFNSRYYKINVQSFWRHGSVEFRHHSGTIEFRKIKNWIKILAILSKKSKNFTFSNGSLLEFQRLFPSDLIDYMIERENELAA